VNLRHVAALALVGWYLMQPPWVSHNTFDASAPLSRWKIATSFDSAADCENFLSSNGLYYRTHPNVKQADWFARLWGASQCIATDDPRLK